MVGSGAAGSTAAWRYLFEHVVVIDGMMVADIAQLNVVGAEEFENDPIGTIDAEAPNFVMPWT